MPCYSPLHAYRGKKQENGKIQIAFKRADSWKGVELELPCGQCIGCRLEKSRQWATRCMHEASLYEQNCFLTLTYNDKTLPKDGSLKLRDYQLFMKRLRKRYKNKTIRFYHCGEYGEHTKRPHYHSIIFNHDFDDKQYFKEQDGNKLYTSKTLDEIWENGFSVIGDVTFESAGYVARYVMKKITGENSDDHYQGRTPEYSTMSRKPGIGKAWIDKYSDDVYPNDHVIIRGRHARPPKYYDDHLAKNNPQLHAQIKLERQNNEKYVRSYKAHNGKMLPISDSSDYRLGIKEKVKKAQIKLLSKGKDGI